MTYSSSSTIRNAGAAADRLFAQLVSLPLRQRCEFYELQAGSHVVAGDGWHMRERRSRPEKYTQRNAEIRRRYAAGETQGQLALVYGLSPSAIAKMIERGRRKDSLDVQTASIPPRGVA